MIIVKGGSTIEDEIDGCEVSNMLIVHIYYALNVNNRSFSAHRNYMGHM